LNHINSYYTPKLSVFNRWFGNLSEGQLQIFGVKLGETYPEPIVNHEFARKRALETFDQITAKK